MKALKYWVYNLIRAVNVANRTNEVIDLIVISW